MTPSQERKHKGSILVLDDDPANLEPLFTILREDGYVVHERRRELESRLRFVKETRPDLVLVDVTKAGMDGYQLCASLKNDAATRAIPVIFISSINQAAALLSGAVDYVTVPFDAEEVSWRIETHISLRRLRETLESAASNRGAQPVAPDAHLERAFREIRVLTQVTGRKHAEEKVRQAQRELERREAFFAEAQRVSSTGSFSWCVATDDITWSAQMYRIYSIDDAVPVTWERIGSRIHPEDHPVFEKLVEHARRDGTDVELEFEHRLQLPDHSVKHVQVVAHRRRSHEGQLEYIGTVRDVTEHRLSEDALGRLRSELAHVTRVTTLGELAASIAHEVKQPLAAIVNDANACLNTLGSDRPDLEMVQEALAAIVADGHRAVDIIQRIRQLATKSASPPTLLDVNSVIREVVPLVRAELQSRQVSLAFDLAPDLPRVAGDRVQLQQVVINLVINAIDAMASVTDREREIVIRSALHEPGSITVSVQDAGVGIDSNQVDALFTAFFTTKAGGMGMGLAISRSIIEAHGGRLWAMPGETHGAVFHFSLPVDASRASARAVPPRSRTYGAAARP